MKLSVIIVSYKVKHYLEQCLVSLQRALSGIDAEIFVVDNHSNDGSVEFIEKRFPDVRLIASNHNLGFSRANNMAIRQCGGEYVLLLNPDTVVPERTIAEVLRFMDGHPRSGGVGVKMLKADGTPAMESRRGLPTPMTSFYKMSGLCARYPAHRRFARYYMSYLPWNEAARIEVISGAFCMLRHAALDKIGLLDEDFFMYGEDIDLSYRLLKGGYENWYVPVPILHYKGESTHKSSFRYVHVFYDAMFIFMRKHYGNMSMLATVPIKTAIYMKAVVTLVRMQAEAVRKSLGFFSPSRETMAQYVFIGDREALGQCRKIAASKGLETRFVEGDSATMPDGHLGLELPAAAKVYVVYDTGAYSYGDILRIFASRPSANVEIGTYSRQTHTIITLDEIFV